MKLKLIYQDHGRQVMIAEQGEVMNQCQIKRVKHPYNQVHHLHQLVEVFYYQLKAPLLVSIVQEAKL